MTEELKPMSLRDALRDSPCPRPANGQSENQVVGECVDRGLCGCQNGEALAGAVAQGATDNAQTTLNEMIEVASKVDDSVHAEWTSDNRATIDRWQVQLAEALNICHAERATVDLTNHHNALLCPYCNPKGLKFAESQSPAANDAETLLHHIAAASFTEGTMYDAIQAAKDYVAGRSQPESATVVEFASHMARLLYNDATLDGCTSDEKQAWLEAAKALMTIFDVRRRLSVTSTEGQRD